MKNKYTIIVEGPDQSGKSSLCEHIRLLANGKVHSLHSNYSKELPSENHRRQHLLISDFVAKQFDSRHYTGNNVVLLDRNYVSDMVYGLIGYGSRGTLNEKFEHLDKVLARLTKNKDVKTFFIYCNPEVSFDPTSKDELLNKSEDDKIREYYNDVVMSFTMLDTLTKHNINFITYDYKFDPQYVLLDEELNHLN